MSPEQTESFVLVDSPEQLTRACADLQSTVERTVRAEGRAPLYLDTEFESNRSGTKLCLLQISAGATPYLVDPLRLRELTPLRAVLGRTDVEWVLHAGLQDVALLVESLDLELPAALFDTQIAWGLLSAEASVSLAYLQFRILGMRSTKTHQADDWLRRPLPRAQQRYAADDVIYLPPMTRELRDMARKKNRLSIIQDASKDALGPAKEPPPPLRLASFRNAWQLGEKNQAALRYLIEWYNGLPTNERRHAPENKVLLSVASRLPEDTGALGRIKGVSRGLVGRHGERLIEGLRSAVAQARAEDFVPIDPAPYATFEEILLEAWLARMRAEVCVRLEVAPELVLPSRLLRAMEAAVLVSGKGALSDPLLGWKKELLEPAIQQFSDEVPPPL